jgi:hypothetical protein
MESGFSTKVALGVGFVGSGMSGLEEVSVFWGIGILWEHRKGEERQFNQAPAGDALTQLGSIFTPSVQHNNALSVLRLSGVRLIKP